jgi:hypothetical protein
LTTTLPPGQLNPEADLETLTGSKRTLAICRPVNDALSPSESHSRGHQGIEDNGQSTSQNPTRKVLIGKSFVPLTVNVQPAP